MIDQISDEEICTDWPPLFMFDPNACVESLLQCSCLEKLHTHSQLFTDSSVLTDTRLLSAHRYKTAQCSQIQDCSQLPGCSHLQDSSQLQGCSLTVFGGIGLVLMLPRAQYAHTVQNTWRSRVLFVLLVLLVQLIVLQWQW